MTNHNTQQLEHQKDPASEVQELNRKFENATVEAILDFIWKRFGSEMIIGTGFGPSGAVLMHKLSEMGLPIKVFYLDTHLLFTETYELRDKYAEQYGIQFERVSTDLSVDEQAKKHGDKLWDSNPDKCCFIRKVLPLKNYLKDKKAWVTGVRRDQSEIRKGTGLFEWDSVNEVIKINP
ncbi:MAG: phosphoadenosine phosphosulfate reductase family protein, partial [Balneolales bacterium]